MAKKAKPTIKEPVGPRKDYLEYLNENQHFYNNVKVKAFFGRTRQQKLALISDITHPTLHSKFHKSLDEVKEILTELRFINKEYVDSEEWIEHNSELLEDLTIRISYKLKELKDWKEIQDFLFNELLKLGLSEEQIWDREYGSLEKEFYLAINKAFSIWNSTSALEVFNIRAELDHSFKFAQNAGKLDELLQKCNQIQLDTLEKLGYINIKNKE